ncbi:hypothetical protein PUN28_014222 [Cardiocondyla obscurior]|uniref:Uncharacterized protein n=1 Tax=Cardiocondyla obscurior TaxID=286306 RepID=A0AAW2F2P3_9HYME
MQHHPKGDSHAIAHTPRRPRDSRLQDERSHGGARAGRARIASRKGRQRAEQEGKGEESGGRQGGFSPGAYRSAFRDGTTRPSRSALLYRHVFSEEPRRSSATRRLWDPHA